MTDASKALEAKASAMVRRGCWDDEALELNLQILEIEPHNLGALCRAGRCYREAGLFDDSLSTYLRAAEYAGDSPMSAKIASTISELTTEAKKAESRDRGERERRKRLDSISDAHEMIRAGSRLRDEERLDLAVMMHTRAVGAAEDTPTRMHALEAYAADLRQLNKPKRAAEAAVHALRLDLSPETNMAAYTILIAALCDLGRNTLASDLAEQVLTVSPNDHYLREAARRAFREEASDLELADAQQEAQAKLLATTRQATFFADASMTSKLGRMVEQAARLTETESLSDFLASMR